MRDKINRKKKPEKRWDSEVNTGTWLDKTVSFSDDQRRQLSDICSDPEFIISVERLGGEYLSHQTPNAPMPKPGGSAKDWKEYRSIWVAPTLSDMKATLKDLRKSKNKVKRLASTSPAHPIWDVINHSWYFEYKRMLGRDFFNRLHYLKKYQFMLETTPEDHPQKLELQAVWDRYHIEDFQKWNCEIIPSLIEISLKHISKAYIPARTNSATYKRFLGFRMTFVLNKFGVNLSVTKDGPLATAIGIVLEACGQPSETPHKYITSEALEQVKNQQP